MSVDVGKGAFWYGDQHRPADMRQLCAAQIKAQLTPRSNCGDGLLSEPLRDRDGSSQPPATSGLNVRLGRLTTADRNFSIVGNYVTAAGFCA